MFQSLASLVSEEKPELGVVSSEHVRELHHVFRNDVSRGHHLVSSLRLFVDEESNQKLKDLYLKAINEAVVAVENSSSEKRDLVALLALSASNSDDVSQHNLSPVFDQLSRCVLSSDNDVSEADIYQCVLSEASGDVMRAFVGNVWATHKLRLSGEEADDADLICAILQQTDHPTVWKDLLHVTLEGQKHFLEQITVSDVIQAKLSSIVHI